MNICTNTYQVVCSPACQSICRVFGVYNYYLNEGKCLLSISCSPPPPLPPLLSLSLSLSQKNLLVIYYIELYYIKRDLELFLALTFVIRRQERQNVVR